MQKKTVGKKKVWNRKKKVRTPGELTIAQIED